VEVKMKKLFVVLLVLLLCASVAIIGCAAPAPTAPTPTAPAAPSAPTTSAPVTSAPVTTPAAPTPGKPAPAAPAKPAAPTGPQYGGFLRIVEPSTPFGPFGLVWTSPFGHTVQQVCEEAWLEQFADGSIGPKLAESYELDNDPAKPSMTFKFRKGIKFHDGTELDADIAKWSVQMLKDSGLFASVTYLKSLDVIDKYTLKTPMTDWRNSIVPAFAQNQHFIVSPTALETKGETWLRWNMVGTGPFRQTEYVSDSYLKAIRFDDYWQTGKPYLQGVDFMFVVDEMTRVALWKSGGADLMNLAGNARIASDFQKEGEKIDSQVAGAFILLPDGANADSPFANLKVRQAVEYAIDKAAIAKAFGFGFWEAASQIPSPIAPAYIADLAARNYDTAKAKQLLTEGGFPNGFKTKIIADNTQNQNVLVALQSQLGEVGIQVDLDIVDPMKLREYQAQGWNNGLVYTPLGMEGNCIPSMGFNFPPKRTGRFLVVKDPPNWQKVYEEAGTSSQMEPKLLQGFTREMHDDVMVIPICWYPNLYVVSKKLNDYGMPKNRIGWWAYADMWFSK
jgi:peptide/nickel transport system substrate-binding protein